MTKKLSNKNRLIRIITVIALWFAVWFLSQGVFIVSDTPLANWLMHGSSQDNFIHATLWIVGVMVIGAALWHKFVRNYSFLKVRSPRLLAAYLLPLVLFIVMLIRPLPFGINPFVYTASMIATCFWQDLLTFGFLQTSLEKLVNPKLAAALTAASFFVGHLYFEFSWLALAYMAGFAIFAYARYRTKSIYLTNALHLAFLLVAF